MEWRSPSSARPKKNRLRKSKVKTLLIAFFGNNGVICKEFVQTALKRLLLFGQSCIGLDSGCCCMIIAVRCVCANSWLSAAYLFSIIHRTPLMWRLRISFHPPPPQPKERHERHWFCRHGGNSRTCDSCSAFDSFADDSFQELYEHCQKFVLKNGDYFEGQ